MAQIKCEQGGKGHGLTVPQKILYDEICQRIELNLDAGNWVCEYYIATKKKSPYPTQYCIDIANPRLKIAIEVDGPSHRHPDVKKADKRKERFFRGEGWSIIRVKNKDVMDQYDLKRVISRIRVIYDKKQGVGSDYDSGI